MFYCSVYKLLQCVSLSLLTLPSVCVVVGVRVAHPHHRRSAAGHRHWAVLWCFRTHQRFGCHALLLSAEHLLQKGKSCWCVCVCEVVLGKRRASGATGFHKTSLTVITTVFFLSALTSFTWLLLSWWIVACVNTVLHLYANSCSEPAGCVQGTISLNCCHVTVGLSQIKHGFPVALQSAEFYVFYRIRFVQTVYFWHFLK